LDSPRRQLKLLEIRPQRGLGQHFLHDPNILRKIVAEASLEAEDVVVEVGAGLGSLTVFLAGRVKRVYALEIDARLVEHLRQRFREEEGVEIVPGDALQFDFAPLFRKWRRKMKLVANLPYEISSPMIFRLLEGREYFSRLVLMVQREVARRIVAPPGTRDYGPLSLWSRLYSRTTLSFSVGPKAFHPPPKVESAVVKFEILERPGVQVEDEKALRAVVRSAFTYRRKTLGRALQSGSFSHLSRERIQEALETSGIPPMARGETLTPEQFISLARSLRPESAAPVPSGPLAAKSQKRRRAGRGEG
jgi:16S rRNA (adenine1518-N6/adenine1519-N6)-dimethyltransferase